MNENNESKQDGAEPVSSTAGLGDIRVRIEGKEGVVDRTKYVQAKTKQLREFGYSTLTEAEVNEQIDALLAKKTFGEGLTVIGMFMEGEVHVA
jgi:hypothetical protein